MKFVNKNHYLMTNLIISVCIAHKIPYRIINHSRSSISVRPKQSRKTIYFTRYRNTINPRGSRIISNNKFHCSTALGKNDDIPVTKQAILLTKRTRANEKDYPLVVRDFTKPLVCKQINGTGGKNIFTNLEKWSHLQHALLKARKRGLAKMLVEEQVEGCDYRILVVRGEIIDCIRRTPARVSGDGKSTIQQLVRRANIKRAHKIQIEPRYLQCHNLRLDTIPEEGAIVQVTGLCNYHKGATLHRIPVSKIHPDNATAFLKTMDVLNLHVAGIDFISTDIAKSHAENGGRITEVNADCNLDLHYKVDNKLKYVEKAVLRMLRD